MDWSVKTDKYVEAYEELHRLIQAADKTIERSSALLSPPVVLAPELVPGVE